LTGESAFKVGREVEGKVTLVKEYGVIFNVENGYTGFLRKESSKVKDLKENDKVSGIILDVDEEKKLLDVSNKITH
jgi:ribosomal protein S1